jgi:pyridoxal phosphate enzyme (YggS family)
VNPALDLRSRLDDVRERIARAAARSGRTPDAVTLVGVVKTVPPDVVRIGLEAGLTDLGENRVQEAEEKIAAIGRSRSRWHLIGHLQRNKAGRAVDLFDRVHSVDSEALADALSRFAARAGRKLPVLVEVNVSGEATKFGVPPGDVERLAAHVLGSPGLALDGLMTVGPRVSRGDDARPGFARLRALRDAAERALGARLPELSMGMSADFEAAVEEGSTFVRVGTAVFGSRV